MMWWNEKSTAWSFSPRRIRRPRTSGPCAREKKKVEKISSMDRLTELAEKVFAVQSIEEMGLK